ncbi:GntR family transcriptional regulator [Kibdelosporangium lantanae]|uniref:GntR family transcriptional regulator n=1 Tax=Kibdelosporangium lantanae TaxID=1497396 RepID=A0ABW3M2H7_9PSEU
MALDPDDPRPPYLQVSGRLRAAIESGELAPGAQLPTYQELADEFDVAVNTAKSAVNQLRGEGLVVIRQGKGSFVRTQPPADDQEPTGAKSSAADLERVWQELAELRRRVAALEKREQG